LFVGLANLPAVSVNFILGLTPVAVAITSLLSGQERPAMGQWVGIGMVITGAALFFFPLQEGGGGATGLPPLEETTLSMGPGAVLLLAGGAALQGIPVISAANWRIVAWLAVVNTALAFTLWNRTLRILTDTESSMINSSMNVQIPLLAVFFLGETLSARQVTGLAFSILGVLIVQQAKRNS
jgi:drug/metabolite transporter (DMT)-like permease